MACTVSISSSFGGSVPFVARTPAKNGFFFFHKLEFASSNVCIHVTSWIETKIRLHFTEIYLLDRRRRFLRKETNVSCGGVVAGDGDPEAGH